MTVAMIVSTAAPAASSAIFVHVLRVNRLGIIKALRRNPM
jgi:hypothetical protein